MRKIILLCAVVSSFTMYAQDYPGKNPAVLVGKELEVVSLKHPFEKNDYSGFFLTETMDIGYKNVYASRNGIKSIKDSLIGKIFRVLEVIPHKNSFGDTKIEIKIENEKTGILHYEYPSYDFEFPFKVIGGLPADTYCADIEKESGKTTRYTTPEDQGITFIKVKSGKTSHTYLSIRASSNSLYSGKKGIVLYLKNNKTIKKPTATLDISVNSSAKYEYAAFVELTAADLELLKANEIIKTDVYVMSENITAGPKFMGYIKCLAKK